VYFLVSAPMEFIPFDEAGIGPGASDWDLVMETTPDGRKLEKFEQKMPDLPAELNTESTFHKTFRYGKYQPEAWYAVMIFGMSIMGAMYSVFFHAFILVEYLRTPAGRLVLRAVRAGAPKMSKTFTMGVIMMLMWTMISWLYFHRDLHAASGSCASVYQCTFKAIQEGFRGDLNTLHGDDHGNIRGTMVPPAVFYEDSSYQIQVVFVLLYYLIWDYILAGIIQGQIIDAFAEMRSDEDAKLADQNKRCMVCSLSRFEVDNAGGKFHEHVSRHHVPKHYLFFFVYLETMASYEDTGMMSYVRDCVQRRAIEFIPIGTCRMMNKDSSNVEITAADLSNQVEELRNSEGERLTRLEEKVNTVVTRMNKLMDNMDALGY